MLQLTQGPGAQAATVLDDPRTRPRAHCLGGKRAAYFTLALGLAFKGYMACFSARPQSDWTLIVPTRKIDFFLALAVLVAFQ